MRRQENDVNQNRSSRQMGRNRNFNQDYDRSRDFSRGDSNRNSDWNRTDEHFDMGPGRERDSDQGSSRSSRLNSSTRGSKLYGSADEYGENIGQGGQSFSRNHQASSPERGGFFGKGPMGYKRSDERIKEEVCEALYRDWHVDASGIEVSVTEGLVLLKGTVDTRQAKRAAENAVEHLSGVEDVQNEIRVKRSEEMDSSLS